MPFNHSSSQTAAQAEALTRDFQNVVADAQELLKALGNDGDAKLGEVKKRVQVSLNQAREHLAGVQTRVSDSAIAAARTTDEYVHHNPWQAVGVSAAVGLLVGFLVARR